MFRDLSNFIHISSASGAGGKFLSTLIFWLANDHIEPQQYWNTLNYHDQSNDMLGYTNFENDGSGRNLEIPIWNDFKFKSDNAFHTMVFAGGVEDFFKRHKDIVKDFPNYKIVNVTFNDDDILTIELNHFWKQCPNTYCERVGVPFVLRELTTDSAREIVEKYMTLPNTIEHNQLLHETNIEIIKQRYLTVLSHHYFIKFSDILKNPEIVMDTMFQIAERPINDFIRNKYQEYRNTQLRFIDKRMPWHPLASKAT